MQDSGCCALRDVASTCRWPVSRIPYPVSRIPHPASRIGAVQSPAISNIFATAGFGFSISSADLTVTVGTAPRLV